MKQILLALFAFAVTSVNATNYYFSTNSGDDSRTSIQAQNPSTPWKTINKLNSIINSLTFGDALLLKRGEVFYGNITIVKSHNIITIGAFGSGAKPIITGLQPVSGWTPIGNGIYEANVGLDKLNMVIFQDRLQPMGRWPKVTAPHAGFLALQSHVGSASITSNMISGAKSFVGGELVIRKWGWILDRGIINSQTTTTIGYSPMVAPGHPSYNYEPLNNYGFFFQNHINALTELGDWMYDKQNRKLKMYFGNKNPAEYNIEIPKLENLVDFFISSYVTLDNLHLKGANSDAIHFDYASNITINSCDINFSGVDGIAVPKTSNVNKISLTNSTITNTNNNAVTAYGTENWIIRNNLIRNTGLVRGMGLSGDGQYNGLSAPGSNSIIEHNQIINTGYNAVEFKGNNTVVKNNYIDTFCTIKSDGGGIYNSAESGYTGRKILSNIVLNGFGDLNGRPDDEANNPFAGNVHGIYMDGGATDVVITGNTVAHCSSSGLELSSPVNTVVTNNTLFNNTFRQIYYWESKGPISKLTVKNNILFATKVNQLINYVDGSSNTVPVWGTLDSNYYCRPLSEPTNIDTGGYSTYTWDDYPDGGTMQMYNYRFYSMDKWQTLTNQDAHSKKSPVPVSHVDNIKFYYNATDAPKTFALDKQYIDVTGKPYNTSVALQPFTSIILMTGSIAQTLTFAPLPDRVLADSVFTLNASASSGLPVTYRLISGRAVITGNRVSIRDTGKVIIQASQLGDQTYYAASPIRHSFNVTLNNCVAPTFLNNAMIVLNASCSNNDGNLTIEPTSGTPPFMYSIDGGTTYVPGANYGYTFNNLSANTYQMRLKDSKGCQSAIVEKEVKLVCANACTPPNFVSSFTAASCANNDGTITIEPRSGVAPYLYSINGGTNYVSGPNIGRTFTALAGGLYRLRVKDANGCESSIVDKNVTSNCQTSCVAPTFLNNAMILLDASCSNNDGNISIIPTSGVAPFMYSKDSGVTYVAGPDYGYTFNGLSAKTYNLRLKDSKGCESAVIQKTIRIVYGAPCINRVVEPTGANPATTLSGLASPSNQDVVTVFPNPNNGHFKVLLQNFSSSKAAVSIIDARGNVIQSKSLNLRQRSIADFDLRGNAPGIYHIKTITSGVVKVAKVVIQ